MPLADDDHDARRYIGEYIERQRLAKLGFTDSIDSLDQEAAEAFLQISVEFDKLEKAEIKKRK